MQCIWASGARGAQKDGLAGPHRAADSAALSRSRFVGAYAGRFAEAAEENSPG